MAEFLLLPIVFYGQVDVAIYLKCHSDNRFVEHAGINQFLLGESLFDEDCKIIDIYSFPVHNKLQ